MLKLTYLLRRRPDLSAEAFAEIWRTAHAGLLAELAPSIGACRYAIGLPIETAWNECLRSSRGLQTRAYDGVLEIWWADAAAYQEGFGSPAGLKAIDAMIDVERRFIDFQKSMAFLTSEETAFDTLNRQEFRSPRPSPVGGAAKRPVIGAKPRATSGAPRKQANSKVRIVNE